jgi:hypothetical protein
MYMPKAKNVIEGKGITDSSKKLYLANLKRLNGGVEPTNYKFLEDTQAIEDKIEKYATNTKRTYYISIVSYLPEKNKLRKYYYDQMQKINAATKNNTEKSEKQKLNWMTQAEILETYEKLKNEAIPFMKKKDYENDTVLKYIVLSLYVLQPPRRTLDYTKMYVVPIYNENLDKGFNYLDLKNKQFIFNNYKTRGTYQAQTVKVSDALFKLLKKYRSDGRLLSKNEKEMSSPQMTQLMNSIFGKKVSVSLLRNIYLTSKYGEEQARMKQDTADMGTSVATASSNYIKQD